MTLEKEILELKEQKDAVILAHYYVSPEVQAIADFVGDSFYLSKKAVSLKARTLVFCGVSFMGESAKILNPEKTVLMPDATADCAMARMADAKAVAALKAQHKDAAVVCYINSTAALKCLSDVCVTSANAVKIVKALPQKEIIFIPDKNLGHFVAAQVPDKHFIYNDGYCPVHEKMAAREIEALKQAHPEANVLVHPECNAAVLKLADYIGSTSGIIHYATVHDDPAFIIGTEEGVRYQLSQENPQKTFYFPKTTPVCRDMKLVTLKKIKQVLETGQNEVQVSLDIQKQAKAPLQKMLALSK
ncbi:MAG: quinolinate synthase NadA [Eubacteriaceae bacterium]|nr:quinolinate synthase NadA [Eubacteriaceae bacterium]MDD4508072.1 quinolinate synthase NadA [Eubacteriaceae bacterium]